MHARRRRRDAPLHVAARAVVLVVEDDAPLRTSMCAALTLMGFLPYGAGSVDAALKILGTEPVNAMVLDIRLPDPTGQQRSGLSLLKFVRTTAEFAEMPILVFTGMQLSASEEQVVRANRAHLFYKPQPYSVLIDHLNGLLNASAS